MPSETPARLLIVDDEAPQMKALCDTLRDYGFETTGYASSVAALEALTTGKFDLLLTDLMMPELDGISLVRSALEKDPDLACVIMTGQGTILTAVEAMQSGALDYILKPFKISVALPVLHRSLEMRHLKLELERREREHLAELELRNEELASFSAAAAHDLRGPLRAINGFTEILTEEYGHILNDGGIEALNRLRSGARKMDNLIEGLLTLARMTATEPHLETVNLTDVAQTIAEEFRVSQPTRSVQFEIEPNLTTLADERMITIALENLIGNALKFTSNVKDAKIVVDRDIADPQHPFLVRDNGAGFDPMYADKLFKPFERLHSAQEFTGSGIGLSTVHRIIKRHNGTIWAESQPGKGATFFFTLVSS